MAKRFRKKKANDLPPSTPPSPLAGFWTPLFLAVTAFLVYWPSLSSGFVYDGRFEILEEGFITSLAHLGDVLSLKVLGMHLMLGPRPGTLLYLMLIAAVCGRDPFGYHLCSNLLHAANVALLCVLLARLLASDSVSLPRNDSRKIRLAAITVTLTFALHPFAAEVVSAVNYSSDLLVTFFTLVALLAAIHFRPDRPRAALLAGCAGAICAFASVACKESGLATALLLVVYWFLYRRPEAKGPWLWFLGSALAVTAAFLVARFHFAPPDDVHPRYLGGSLFHVFFIQPRLWVFMMGQMLWPARLSADYTLQNADAVTTSLAFGVLAVVLLLQAWLAWESRLGALGVAIYWLGLATVSNFTPLFRILGDRFYYLPMAGVALQLLALLLFTLKSRFGFWLAIVFLLAALVPLTNLTVAREWVFFSQFTLWSDTAQVSPYSVVAQYNLGNELLSQGRTDDAIDHYYRSLKIDPTYSQPHNNLGDALFEKGRIQEAIVQFHAALHFNPNNVQALTDLGYVLSQNGRVDEGLVYCQKAVKLAPQIGEVHNNLGLALDQKGQVDQAIDQYQKCLAIKPDDADARINLGGALLQKGQVDPALVQLREAVRLEPHNKKAHDELAKALSPAGKSPAPIKPAAP